MIEEGVGRLVLAIGQGKFREELHAILQNVNSQAFDIGFEEGKAYQRQRSRYTAAKKAAKTRAKKRK